MGYIKSATVNYNYIMQQR